MIRSERAVGAWAIDKILNLRAEMNKQNCELSCKLPVKMEQDCNGCVSPHRNSAAFRSVPLSSSL